MNSPAAATLVPPTNIVTKEWSYGLKQGRTLLLSTLLDAGCDSEIVDITPYVDPNFPFAGNNTLSRRLHRFVLPLDRRCRRPREFNLFIETAQDCFYPMARRHLLMPNQEWFRPYYHRHLPNMTAVLCKTHHAVDVFTRLGCQSVYTSFTSHDRRRASLEPKRPEFLSLATTHPRFRDRILALWMRHPEWPRLTMVSKDPAPGFDAPNIRRIERYLDEEEVIRLQNEHLFHLCVSRAEGFGHKLNEGMSCGAIVIATDAPPMNELITPERGLLVKYSHSEPMNAGTAYDFDEADLERTIEKCLRLTTPEIEQLSRNARQWFEDNDRYFRTRLPEALRELA